MCIVLYFHSSTVSDSCTVVRLYSTAEGSTKRVAAVRPAPGLHPGDSRVYAGAVVQWCSCTLVQYHSCKVVQSYSEFYVYDCIVSDSAERGAANVPDVRPAPRLLLLYHHQA